MVRTTPWIEDTMSLRRSLFLALASLPFLLGPTTIVPAQQPASPALPVSVKGLTKDFGPLTRTGARQTLVVAAIDRVRGAVVNIHSERNIASSGGEAYPMPGSANRVNGMGTGIVIDPR